MTAIDIVIILLLVMFGVVGWKQGIIKEAVQLIGMIVILVIAFMFKGELGNIFCKWLPFFNFSGSPLEGMTTLNILLYQVLGFVIIFTVLYAIYTIILKLSGVFQKILDWTIILLIPSKIGGLIIGLLEGYILLFVLLLIITGLPASYTSNFTNSNLVQTIVYNTPILSSASKDVTNSMKDIYVLVDEVAQKKITTNDANLKTVDIMLKYDLVTHKTVEQLVILDKLKGVKGIDAVIAKYK